MKKTLKRTFSEQLASDWDSSLNLDCNANNFVDVSPSNKRKKESNCQICYEYINDEEKMILIEGCGDGPYCLECIQSYYQISLRDKKNITCPKCKTDLSHSQLKLLLTANQFQQYEEIQLNNTLNSNPDIYSSCPTPDCSYIFVWLEGDDTHFRCEKCLRHYCLKCKCDYHHGVSCIKYQQWAIQNAQTELLFTTGSKFKQCPKCKAFIEKSEGCDHMTCVICKHEFCFKCAKTQCQCEWRNWGVDDDDEELSDVED